MPLDPICQGIDDEIKGLQQELQNAAPGEKPAIAAQIGKAKKELEKCRQEHPDVLPPSQCPPPPPPLNQCEGFADIHNHQFANLGFGGKAFHGSAFGNIADALPWCTPDHGPDGTQDLIGDTMTKMYGRKGPPHGHKVGGYPEFDGWPRWDSITHQAVYEDWLYRAVEGGLRLMVMLAVNNEYLCGKANSVLGCNDMEAVDRQLAAAKAMEAYIDNKCGGAGKGWYRIVYSPQEARTVMAAGKLAVVLGIEVDYLFNCHGEADITVELLEYLLDHYYTLGVRHLFPIHFSNNGFGGTALQNALEWCFDHDNPGSTWNHFQGNPLNPIPTIGAYEVYTDDGKTFGYKYRTGRRNIKGLTGLGKALISGMISRGMIIDVDHMSARSKTDTLDICEANDYPVVAGHVGFVEISRDDKRHEGQLLPEEVERIRKLGGMVAIIVHQGELNEIATWADPGQPVIPHICGNTSNTVVQAYLYAASKMQGSPVGFGTDLNGFAGLPGPRFGGEACNGGGASIAGTELVYPFTAAATGEPMDRSVVGNKTFNINVDGLAHVGMLPDLIADFQAMGLSVADLVPLLNSAGGYVTLWEKAWRHQSQPLVKPSYEQLGGEPIASDPAVCSWAPGRLDVFVRGTDNALWTKWYDGNNWSGYLQLGGEPIASDPAAVSWGPNRIDVFVRGTDNALWTKWYDGNNWRP
jgi:microsomal dipeptidase-like Zn-dependent dipeptidase